MSEFRKHQQAAIEAVARHFSATVERGKNPPDAYLQIGGKRVAVEVTAIQRRIADRGCPAEPRLRLDKVALRVVRVLQANLNAVVPEGETVIVTITAPIRLAAKTTSELEERIRACLMRRSRSVEVKDSIHGNQIQFLVVKGIPRRAAKVIGFVHNPDTDPGILLEMTRSLLERIGAAAGKRASARFAGDRWLVVAVEDELPWVETYRQVYSRLSMPSDFKKIVMVVAGGRVETLTG